MTTLAYGLNEGSKSVGIIDTIEGEPASYTHREKAAIARSLKIPLVTSCNPFFYHFSLHYLLTFVENNKGPFLPVAPQFEKLVAFIACFFDFVGSDI